MTSEMKETRRKRLIKLVHVGKAKIGMDDDAYRAFLEGISGKDSAADMSIRQLETALRVMRKNGFEEKPSNPPTRIARVKTEERGTATLAQLEYIKGMWQTCARNKSDEALGKMIKRIAGVDHIRFLTVPGAQKVILALRDMMVKAAIDPDTSEALDGK